MAETEQGVVYGVEIHSHREELIDISQGTLGSWTDIVIYRATAKKNNPLITLCMCEGCCSAKK
jgi:hypothetical protein